MVDLKDSREKIDSIDKQIVELFEQRMNVANEVAEYKRSTGKPVFDKAREDEKLTKLGELSHSEFNKHAVTELFSQIMSISRMYQYGVLAQESGNKNQFDKLEKIPVNENTKVVYFGVEGTHTQSAMEEFFGPGITGRNCKTFKEVMDVIDRGEADYGVLPIENSSTGGIADNYDLLIHYDNAIVGEYIMKIDQCLMALPGVREEEIRTVYSHPQGIMQCSEYLEAHPNMEAVDFASTAECAKKVATEGRRDQAAIASRKAAQVYGLEIIGDAIQKEKTNRTRFIIIAKKKMYFENSKKIALCIELPHKSGSLYRILSHFIYNDLNLLQIESRPIKGKPFEYRFFIDVEGNLSMPQVKNALRGVLEEASQLSILGNY